MKYVLVIEDDIELREIMKDRIDEEGFRCVVSSTRVEMLSKLRNQHFDLIISDLNIKGSEGPETLTNLFLKQKEDKKRVPIIVVSGYVDDTILNKFGKHLHGVFVKPVNYDLLLNKIHEVLG